MATEDCTLLKKERTSLRRIFTNTCNRLEAYFNSPLQDKNLIISNMQRADETYIKIDTLDKNINKIMLESVSDADYYKEIEECDEYKTRFLLIKSKSETMMEKLAEKITYKNMRLPKLELRKFDGNIRNWLHFWGQFRKIDEDTSLDNYDKFQYLLQSMEANTEARKFVECFPPTATSYTDCLDQLKARYGKDELLIMVYVRELLSLILKNKINPINITTLYDQLVAQLTALDSLGVTKDKYSAFILPMIESTLPHEILQTWERSRPTALPIHDELEALLKFLKREVECSHRMGMTMAFMESQTENSVENITPTASCFVTKTTTAVRKCIWCDKTNHGNLECYQMPKMTLEQRREHLRKKKACCICLKIGHHAKTCKVFIQCFICKKRHSTALCPGNSTPKSVSKSDEEDSARTLTSSLSSLSNATTTTLLQTVIVHISNGNKKIPVRALFDSGSQRSYVKDEIMERLQIQPVKKEDLKIQVFGGHNVSSKFHNLYNFCIENINNSFKFEISALGQNFICNNIPRINNDNQYLNNLLLQHNIILTDKGEDYPDIGILIGADFSGFLMTSALVHLPKGLTAIRSKLGWTLQGKISMTNNLTNINLLCTNLSDFWSLETLGIRDPIEVKSKIEAEAEVVAAFEKSVTVNTEGRYEVQLPWKVGHDNIYNNYNLALRRMQSMTKKLVISNKFTEYDNILKDWCRSGIIEVVENPDIDKSYSHYLPHRPVMKESSLTTKLRPVFDASAKDIQGKALNSCLEKGPNFIENIPKLLVRFRMGAIGITADIAKAFLNISVAPQDRHFLRFLWWTDDSQTGLLTYQHCRVVFGLTCSPFLLSATILHHLENVSSEDIKIAQHLQNSFYVDNCVTSLDTGAEVRDFITKAKLIMKRAKFDLRQWVTAPLQINETSDKNISVLGLVWDTCSDELYCNTNSLPELKETKAITKRNLLSLTQRIFDPIGILCPVTLVPKIILQETWRRDISWDEPLPTDLEQSFRAWYKHLTCLSQCRIPRRLTVDMLTECGLSLHLFTDASQLAIAACIFLRSERQGKVHVQLISAKSRVAPPKGSTIPRLELTAALIGVRLLKKVKEHLNLPVIDEYYWTDSGVTLYWIKRQLPWNTFIGNRVKEIRQYSKVDNWHHISGSHNWADIASRGCTAKELHSLLWWEGPAWLKCDAADWPQSTLVVDEKTANLELKKSTCNINITKDIEAKEDTVCNRLTRISKYTKIVRIVAWILRFIKNTKKQENIISKELTFEECETAEIKLIMLIQFEDHEQLNEKSRHLKKFYDNNNILRIETKLLLCDLPETIKKPYLLSASNIIVKRMVEQKHIQLQHAGTNIMITDIRKRFWILGIRRLVKSVINNCMICKRFSGKNIQVPTAPLPTQRVESSAPFQTVGIDLAGPLMLRNEEKCWVVLYTCAVYRAVHLELTHSLSTDAFLMTLRRFIARRGRPTLIITDNGTNFVGSNNMFAGLDWDAIQRQSTIYRIKWRFNAPTAAWWGGFFERLIRIMKDLLRRVLGRSCLYYVELETILCDCEAIMNSRPLTFVEDDKAMSLESLTPAHFLQTITQTDSTDIDCVDSKSLNIRFRYLQKLRSDFRERFKTEYLTNLIQKSSESKRKIKIGEVVLIQTEEKRIKWPLGLIIEIFEGRDGIGRTALLKTAFGYKTRPLQRLFPLEVQAVDLSNLKPSSIPKDSRASTPPKQTVEDTHAQVTRRGRVIKIPSRYDL
ncbi:unnamed protein product [Euphydryas editha]|uniref:Integrase catalytic domain-containing protein n=1 Tax=Euphydryas editha TaxID=104508 RepID=A0AAU9U8D9_EUPED|nr:unnamed protein product [Euphydryas editha]